jgi:MFS family permease
MPEREVGERQERIWTAPTNSLGLFGKFAVLSSGIIATIGVGTIAVVLPSISDYFSATASPIEIKTVATIFGVGVLLGAPLGGYLSDYVGRRKTLIASIAIVGLAGCGIMAMNNLWIIIGARLLIGIATGALGVAMAAVVGDYFTGNRQARWIGYSVAISTLFNVSISPVAGALADVNWRYAFILYLIAIPILLAVLFGIPKQRSDSKIGPEAPVASGLTVRDMAPMVLLAVLLGTVAMGTSLYWPFRLREVGVNMSRDIALYAIPNTLLITASSLSYGRFRKRLSVSQVFVLGGIVSCIGLLVIGLASGPVGVMVGLAIEGFAIGLLTPNLTNYALAVATPDTRGRTVGWIKGALFVSPFGAQFFLEPLNQAGGASWPIFAIAALAAVFGLAVAFGLLGKVRLLTENVDRPAPSLEDRRSGFTSANLQERFE